MSDTNPTSATELVAKIARLVEEMGWNQEDFARQAGLNRQTARQILLQLGDRRLRNATIGACARALGLTVSDLRNLPLDRLLPRMNVASGALGAGDGDSHLRRQYEKAMQPELLAWMDRHVERASRLSREELDELLSLQGTGGPLTSLGVERFVGLLERKRVLIQQIHTIAGTEYLDLLERLVQLMYEKVQPYSDRR